MRCLTDGVFRLGVIVWQSVREKVGDAIVARGKHRVKWDSPDVSAWVTELSERVFTLQVRQHAPHAYTYTHCGLPRAETAIYRRIC